MWDARPLLHRPERPVPQNSLEICFRACGGGTRITPASTLGAASESKADAIEVSLASEILGFPTETLGPMYWAHAYTRHFLMSQRRDVDDFVLPLPDSRVRRAAGLQLNGTRMTSYG